MFANIASFCFNPLSDIKDNRNKGQFEKKMVFVNIEVILQKILGRCLLCVDSFIKTFSYKDQS